MQSTSPFFFAPLYPFCADLIVIDPPWEYELFSAKGQAKSAQAHYDCMPDDEIRSMPVLQLASRDCWIFLWATAPKLDFCVGVMRHWGFRYVSFTCWRKVTRNGKRAIGPGYIVRSEAEIVLIGAIGEPARTKPLDGIFDGERREHSRKPETFYERVERFAPRARKVDIFGRQSRPGWLVWGKEATKFDGHGRAERPTPQPADVPTVADHALGPLFLEGR